MDQPQRLPAPSFFGRLKDYFSSPHAEPAPDAPPGPEKIDWSRAIPYSIIHFMCLGVIWVGWSWPAVAVACFLYACASSR